MQRCHKGEPGPAAGRPHFSGCALQRLGILAKKPDLRYKKLEPAREAELLATQSAILDTAAQLLKAGGRLVYSTCTIDPAENQQQIAAFLARHPEFTVVEPAAALPAGMTAGEHGALSVPTRTGMDGFFLCAMQKTGKSCNETGGLFVKNNRRTQWNKNAVSLPLRWQS